MADTKRTGLSSLAEALTSAYRAGVSTFIGGTKDVISAGEPMQARETAGEAVPLQFQFRAGENLTVNTRRELTSFEVLRQIADNHDMTRISIEVRKEQLGGMAWDIVPAEPDDKNDYSEQIKIAKEFFKKPDRINTFYDWIGMVLEEVLVIDALTLYRRRTKGGQLYGIDLVDGATIKPLIDNKGRIPIAPLPAYQQVIYGYPQGSYTTEELIYKPKNKRVHTVYGLSPVEYVMMTVNIALRRQAGHLSYYTEGTTPDGGLYEVPETWTPSQIKQYQEYWDAIMAGNTAKKNSLRFVPKGGYHATKEFKVDPAFDEWLARLVSNAFGIDPQIFSKHQNKATAQVQSDMQTDIGLKPLVTFLQGILTDIVQEDLGFTNLAFKWLDEKASDEALQITKNVQYVQAGIYSRDEVRVAEGREPSIKGGMPAFIMRGDGTPLFINDEMYERYKEPPEEALTSFFNQPQQSNDTTVQPDGKQPPANDDVAHKPQKTPEGAEPVKPTGQADKEVYDELRQWEKFAVSRFGKANSRPFEPKVIPTYIAKRLQMDIELAESTNEMRTLFKEAVDKPFKSVTAVEKDTKALKKN